MGNNIIDLVKDTDVEIKFNEEKIKEVYVVNAISMFFKGYLEQFFAINNITVTMSDDAVKNGHFLQWSIFKLKIVDDSSIPDKQKRNIRKFLIDRIIEEKIKFELKKQEENINYKVNLIFSNDSMVSPNFTKLLEEIYNKDENITALLIPRDCEGEIIYSIMQDNELSLVDSFELVFEDIVYKYLDLPRSILINDNRIIQNFNNFIICNLSNQYKVTDNIAEIITSNSEEKMISTLTAKREFDKSVANVLKRVLKDYYIEKKYIENLFAREFFVKTNFKFVGSNDLDKYNFKDSKGIKRNSYIDLKVMLLRNIIFYVSIGKKDIDIMYLLNMSKQTYYKIKSGDYITKDSALINLLKTWYYQNESNLFNNEEPINNLTDKNELWRINKSILLSIHRKMKIKQQCDSMKVVEYMSENDSINSNIIDQRYKPYNKLFIPRLMNTDIIFNYVIAGERAIEINVLPWVAEYIGLNDSILYTEYMKGVDISLEDIIIKLYEVFDNLPDLSINAEFKRYLYMRVASINKETFALSKHISLFEYKTNCKDYFDLMNLLIGKMYLNEEVDDIEKIIHHRVVLDVYLEKYNLDLKY